MLVTILKIVRVMCRRKSTDRKQKIASEDIRKLYGKLDALQDGDTLVLAGSIPDTMPESMYMDIMEHLQNKKLNIVVDATRDLLMNVLAYHPFLIKPNNHELGEIFHTVINDKDDVVTYAKRMQEKGARNVLVSMAGDGAVLVTEDGQEFRADAPKGKLVNSVGAGDSMVAGFIYGYLKWAGADRRCVPLWGMYSWKCQCFFRRTGNKKGSTCIDGWTNEKLFSKEGILWRIRFVLTSSGNAGSEPGSLPASTEGI